jgi:hypothetical protein
MQDAIGPYGEGMYDTTPGARIYNELVRMMRREVATFALPPSGGPYCTPDKEYFDWFLNEPDNIRVLDGLELACRALEVVVEPDKHNFRGYAKTSTKDAVDEINARLLESGYGYQYASGQILRVDSQLVHAEIVVPALAVLTDKKFKSAEKEFLAAHSAYRNQDYETCLIECGKSFESILKVIASERRWQVQPNDPAKRLLDAAYTSGFIDPALQAEFTALRSLLESSVPVMRNKMAGHGAGQATRNVPRHFASLQLHQTAAMILFLADHHSQNP